MKVFLVLTALFVAVCALPIEERINGENGWYIPQIDGSNKWMDRDEAEQLLAIGNTERKSDAVAFYLYTKSNPTEGQRIEATDASIRDSHFNKDDGTRFVIHGWGGRYTDGINTRITKAWLSRGKHNVIVVGWDAAQSVDYISSVRGVPDAGEKVGEMIKYLHEKHGMSLDTLYVIGHSLGAQVSGFAGKTVGEGKIHTIIGLDPAMPLFSYDDTSKRLCSTDAYYVESIQTNGGMKGYVKPIGRGTFYPNGGKKQPGCGVDIQGTCSHGRSVTYYVEAVTEDNFGTIKCHDYEDAVAKECGTTYSGVRMGADVNAYMVSGDFYVPVNSESPFGNIK